MNELVAGVQKDKDFDPLRAFAEQRAGAQRAAFIMSGGSQAPGNYGEAFGPSVSAKSIGDVEAADPGMALILKSLMNPETYGMKKDAAGNTVFDPDISPDLAMIKGGPQSGGYTLGGKESNFGSDEAIARSGEDITGALSGASMGAGAGAAFGPWGAGIGAGVGAAYGYFSNRGKNREATENRQANIDKLNERAAAVALEGALDPNRALFAALSGRNRAQFIQEGGFSASPGYGEAGSAVANKTLGEMSAPDQEYINAMMNLNTFGLGASKNNDRLIFDPTASNPMNLYFGEGKAKTGAMSRQGQPSRRRGGSSGAPRRGDGNSNSGGGS
jgi:hypothetical protein